jgi:hypothetical protein
VTISLCESSVDVFVPYLGNLSALLDHAAAYARAKNIDPAILLNLRLAPNMYQVADTAAIDFVRSLPRAEINRAGDKEVVFTFKNGAKRKFHGRSLLLRFSVPPSFFTS